MHIYQQNGGGIQYQTTPALAAKDAEIARLRVELQNAAKAALDAVALSCEKEREADALRAEVEGLRNALEKIASIRLNDHVSIDAAYGHACSIANEALSDHSDAAMGASA
ncbi:TPA: hypothetical protein QEK98_002954 [Stenotrophomonas maltophilia]|nr:hypothetical protein [Stenotrophomonas maltophilia]